MNIDKNDTQSKRFSNVLDYLKSKGISNREVLDCYIFETNDNSILNRDDTYFSNIKAGKIKNIPNSLIIFLQNKYHINPDYLNLESSHMLDTTNENIKNFEKILREKNIVNGDNNKYLHVTIDKNLIDLLTSIIELDKYAKDNPSFDYEQERRNLIESFSNEPNPTEYVLLPRNYFSKIVKESKNKAEKVQDVINLIDYYDYPTDDNLNN